jgi:hypothetical protein
VIGGGVRPGPPLTQQARQRFAGVVQEAEQRMPNVDFQVGVADSFSE